MSLLLKFVVRLEEFDPKFSRHYGPLFHRWLPDGEKDALVLDTGDPKAELQIWFERRGFVEGDYIRFDYQRREVDPKVMSAQAILEGGPIFGLLEIQELSPEELASVQEDKTGSDPYIKLGKRIVKKLIYPPIHRFVNVLRTNYGQHWVRNFEKWDSRKGSLGYYCDNILELRWSLDGGKTWKPFIPDEKRFSVTLIGQKSYSGYLTEEDWKEIRKIAEEDYEPSLACLLLCRAQRLLDRRDLKYALIEAVTAIEVAIDEFIKSKMLVSETLVKSASQFFSLPLGTRTTIVAGLSGKVSANDIENAIEAIAIRNGVVHEGSTLPSNTIERLNGLLKTTAALASGPPFRFLTASPSNAILPTEVLPEDRT